MVFVPGNTFKPSQIFSVIRLDRLHSLQILSLPRTNPLAYPSGSSSTKKNVLKIWNEFTTWPSTERRTFSRRFCRRPNISRLRWTRSDISFIVLSHFREIEFFFNKSFNFLQSLKMATRLHCLNFSNSTYLSLSFTFFTYVSLSFSLSVFLSFCLTVSLSVYLSVHLSISLYKYLSNN
jgi:hypothetical protein